MISGYTPFSFDITDFIENGENQIFLIVRDDELGQCASGKQSHKRQSYGCFYTRTTGIWQTVWLEEVPTKYIKDFYFYPNIKEGTVTVDLLTSISGTYHIKIFFEDRMVGEESGKIDYRKKIKILLSEKHLWDLGKGNLYDVIIQFEDDKVFSYFGLREVKYKSYDFLLNNQ